nr:MAG TPA: hypothetical protein [Caudoviricetes sp.]
MHYINLYHDHILITLNKEKIIISLLRVIIYRKIYQFNNFLI